MIFGSLWLKTRSTEWSLLFVPGKQVRNRAIDLWKLPLWTCMLESFSPSWLGVVWGGGFSPQTVLSYCQMLMKDWLCSSKRKNLPLECCLVLCTAFGNALGVSRQEDCLLDVVLSQEESADWNSIKLHIPKEAMWGQMESRLLPASPLIPSASLWVCSWPSPGLQLLHGSVWHQTEIHSEKWETFHYNAGLLRKKEKRLNFRSQMSRVESNY